MIYTKKANINIKNKAVLIIVKIKNTNPILISIKETIPSYKK